MEGKNISQMMDEELDKCLKGVEPGKRYEDPWPEDRWQEEMDKHPFFMKESPEPTGELHPLVQGLQDLKYDPNENTPLELAIKYKDDGNFYMKAKKFRMAILSYDEALKTKCGDVELLAVIHNNRSAAHYFLQNYRSSLLDAQKCLEYKHDYPKASWRAAQCAFELKRFDLCEELCQELLEMYPNYREVALELQQKSKRRKKEIARNQREEEAMTRRHLQRFNNLCSALRSRNVRFEGVDGDDAITMDILKPKYSPLEDHGVHLDIEGRTLFWPMVFFYPELRTTEFSQENSEYNQMIIILEALLTDGPLTNDSKDAYRLDNVNVYYENRLRRSIYQVDKYKTIGEIVAEHDFLVMDGALCFFILPKCSLAEEEFLQTYSQVILH